MYDAPMSVQYIARIICDKCGATVELEAEASVDNSASGWSGCDCKAELGYADPGGWAGGYSAEYPHRCPACYAAWLAAPKDAPW